MDSCVKCLINGGGETMSSKVEKNWMFLFGKDIP